MTPAQVQGDIYTAAVLLGGRDVMGQVVEMSPGVGPFQMIFKSGLGKLRGTVEKGEGANVFLISRNATELLTYRQVPCGPGGAFEMSSIPPGDYYAVALDGTNGTDLPPADLPASIIPLATSVRVDAGAMASVDLRLKRLP